MTEQGRLGRRNQDDQRALGLASPALGTGTRLVGRAWRVLALACALALVPAGAASAATAAGDADEGRDSSDVTIGVVIILVVLVLLFLGYRVLRKRLRG
ncbi:hypothetical protein I6A84_37705 [Frankia sp. CNm7]|uniref:Uncharacterized protein n=1 Tax=Frankia nepalensis TaxID=1836974 RepID=A0A937RB99_9ACTN|nr:hypothetical protein [Frankia nepalensis]MBL7495763.1 hypothetical protein [Frankia nepalensis]MBL7513006.1 hypothetical protein [Frankia nepalensis]MBL7523628.1 hypothetical protein [Frankia nepalensis]MBL7627127.1 hypothetical protein [Frankia nepalensis]